MPATDATVVGRLIFFNHSAFDGDDPAPNALDDAAISPAAAPLLPGGVATRANVSDYFRGLNGVMVDVDHLAAGGSLSADDFVFRVGNTSGDPNAWPAAPAPSSVTVRRGAGLNGSDRVTLVWPDGAIRNAWLQVTVLDSADTGLSAPDVFYFASLPGDVAGPGVGINSRDLIAVRRARGTPADAGSPLDPTRDGRVNARDLAAVRQNLFSRLDLVQPAATPPTYYVSPTGDDAADGRSPLSAWRTAAKVDATALPPGAHVLFERGGEWHETLAVSSSGTAGAPVVFGSYGTGLKPKFWGSDAIDPSSFEPVAGADSTYRIVANAAVAVNSIQADHEFFFAVYLATSAPPDPQSAIAAVKATPRTWYQNPATGDLYVHTAGDDPRSARVLYTASVRENPVLVSAQHDVVVRNLVTDESAKFGGGYGFYVGESTNVVLEGCEAYRAGKHHFGAINTDNFVGRDLYAAWAMPNQGYGGATAYVTYSDFHRPDSRSSWYDVTYDERDRSVAPYLAFLSHGGGIGDLLVDTLHARGGIGMSVAPDGGARVRVHGGLLEDVGFALYAANAVVDGMTLRGPRVGLAVLGSGDVVQNVLIDGARPDFADAAALVNYGSGNTLRFNTIRIAPDTGWPGAGVAIKTQFGIGPTIYGNIIDAPRALRIDPGAVPTFVSDHNLFVRDPAFIQSDGTARTLDEWRAQSGQEASSSVGDPLFTDAAGGDFTPLPGSPALDALTPQGPFVGITSDLLGTSRPQGLAFDLGAVEALPGPSPSAA